MIHRRWQRDYAAQRYPREHRLAGCARGLFIGGPARKFLQILPRQRVRFASAVESMAPTFAGMFIANNIQGKDLAGDGSYYRGIHAKHSSGLHQKVIG